MAAIAINEQQLKINSFLGKQMMQNNKTNEEILALRTTECAEVTIQGDNIKTMTVEDLETKFQQQQEQPGAANMITIPSTDILQWKASFPLQETSEQVLAELSAASILNQRVKKRTGFGLVLNQTKSHLVFFHRN